MKKMNWLTVVQWVATAATVLVVLIWALIFNGVAGTTGESLLGYLPCLFAPTADCNMLRSMAWLQGINVFEPLAFWWFLSVAVVAGLARRGEI